MRVNHPEMRIFWVCAGNLETFAKDYAWIARICNVPNLSRPGVDELQVVKDWLVDSNSGQWIMILDGADDEAVSIDLAGYLPRCTHGSILVTSRSKVIADVMTEPSSSVYHVSPIDQDVATQLLRNFWSDANGRIDDKSLKNLLEELDHLPMAVIGAASYITTNNMPVHDHSQYALVTSKETFAQQIVDSHGMMKKSVVSTLMLEIDDFMTKHSKAGSLLSLMSQLSDHAIPDSLLKAAFPEWSLLEFSLAFNALKNYSLVTQNTSSVQDTSIELDSEPMYELHQIVQLVTQKWLEKHGRSLEWAQKALQIMSHEFPYPGFKMENWKKAEKYLPHATTVLKQRCQSHGYLLDRAMLLHRLGDYLWEQHDLQRAHNLVEEAIAIWEKYFEHHPYILDALLASKILLISVLNDKGTYGDAVSKAEACLPLVESIGWDNHHKRALFKVLAMAYAENNQFEKAENTIRAVLDVEKRIKFDNSFPGDRDGPVMVCEFLLAFILYKQDKQVDAGMMLDDAMDFPQYTFRLDLLRILHQVSSILLEKKIWSVAEKLLEQQLQFYQQVGQMNRSSWMWISHDLATCYLRQGQFEKAEQFLRSVLDTTGKTWQTDLYQEVDLRMELAKSMLFQNHDPEALRFLDETVRIAKGSLPSSNIKVLECEKLLNYWGKDVNRSSFKAEFQAELQAQNLKPMQTLPSREKLGRVGSESPIPRTVPV
jgi:tetratricopeptide (TPR) repeat protein